MKGPSNGKKMLGVPIGAHVLQIIHLPTDQILIQVLVDTIVNTGSREDLSRIGSPGTVCRQAINSTGECLTDELINTAKGSSTSYVIKEKDKLERVAKSNW
ncbi:40S ribosomal protein S5-B [Mycena leptocephala]|nr:40S ribosomal protein S5-B [Mycena leptocephala]